MRTYELENYNGYEIRYSRYDSGQLMASHLGPNELRAVDLDRSLWRNKGLSHSQLRELMHAAVDTAIVNEGMDESASNETAPEQSSQPAASDVPSTDGAATEPSGQPSVQDDSAESPAQAPPAQAEDQAPAVEDPADEVQKLKAQLEALEAAQNQQGE